MKLLLFLILAVLVGCATVDSVKTWVNKKTVTEQAIITAQEDVSAAYEVGAETHAFQEFREAKSFLLTARGLMEDKNFDTAQEMAARASASAKKAKSRAEEEKRRKRGGPSKRG